MNISPAAQKMLLAGVLFGAWSYLVFTGKVATTDYVENIKILLGGLGLYHVVGPRLPATSSAPSNGPAPTTVVNE
jgi:hypothetical protein